MMTLDTLRKEVLSSLDIEFIGIKFQSDIIEKECHNHIFYIIGNDYEDEVGIRKDDYSVYSLSEEDSVFMNSSFNQLIKCIEIFTEIIDFSKDYSDDKERVSQVKEIRKRFKETDRMSLKNGAWWTYILEQSEDGIL